MGAAGSTFIGFSAYPGHVAQDGEGKNSPFATALLKQITRQDSSIFDVWADVTNDVLRATSDAQRPWISGSPASRFCIPGCISAIPVAHSDTRPPPPSLAAAQPLEATNVEAAKPTFRLIRQVAWPLALVPGVPATIRVPTHSSNVLLFALVDLGSRGVQRLEGKFSSAKGGAYLSIVIPADITLKTVNLTVTVQERGSRSEETVSRTLAVQK